MVISIFWIPVFVVPCCLALQNLRYSELEDIGAACPPKDTCTVTSRKDFLDKNCECDSQCQVFDDCCIDADLKTNVDSLDKFTCIQDGMNLHGAYAINKCQSGWRGPAQVRHRCESINDLSDPLIAAPVTDTENGVTYKNRYCAECNGADPAHLQSWIIMVSCKSLISVNSTGNITWNYVQEKLVYKTTSPDRNKWGLYYWDEELGRNAFYPCDLIFQLPTYLRDSVRMCRPNVISTCPANWRQRSIREKCEAYTAVMYGDKKTYRNPHCAICNNVDLTSLRCSLTVHQRAKIPLPFMVILDFNRNDGEMVGEVDRCPAGKKYDSFFKKCRTLVCALPGQVMRGDSCVREYT